MLHKGVKHILLPQFYLYMLTDSLMIFITIKILKSFDDSESYQLYLLLFNTILTICTTQQLDEWRLNYVLSRFLCIFFIPSKESTQKIEKCFIFYQTNFSFTKHSIFCNLPGLCLMRGGRISVANKLIIPTPNRKSLPKIFIRPSPKIPQ